MVANKRCKTCNGNLFYDAMEEAYKCLACGRVFGRKIRIADSREFPHNVAKRKGFKQL